MSRLVFLGCLTAALACSGCGGGGGSSLSGAVTYNGEPVTAGTIAFTPTSAGTPFGAKITDGKYTTEKPTAGNFTVLVHGDSTDSVPLTRETAAQGSAGPMNYIPENAEGNSKAVDVTGNSQTLDFAITGPARK